MVQIMARKTFHLCGRILLLDFRLIEFVENQELKVQERREHRTLDLQVKDNSLALILKIGRDVTHWTTGM